MSVIDTLSKLIFVNVDYKDSVETHTKLLCGIIVFFTVTFLLIALITHSRFIDSYFVADHTNTAMDYFHMLANGYYKDPYVTASNYPAFCFLIWKILFSALPEPIIKSYSDGYFLRENMIACIGYCVFMIISIISLMVFIDKIGGKLSYKTKTLLKISILISGPMLFLIERGNILILAFSCLLGYLALYDSPDKKLRYVSYCLLAVSTAIKLYPILFGLLSLIRNGFKRETLDLIMICILMVIIPFYFFNGIESMAAMLNGLNQSSGEAAQYGLGHNYSFSNLIKIIFACFSATAPNIYLTVGKVFAAVLSVALFLTSKDIWKKCLAIVVFCIWIPDFSYTYTLLLFVVPLFLYLFTNVEYRFKYTIAFALILSLILSPMMYSVNEFVFASVLPLSYGTVLVNGLIVLLVFDLLFHNIRKIIEKRGVTVEPTI